ncbi:hypothetical protein DPMN_171266 [Dreissena polymorpha]|uniref:Uncharacterized protein n=1 Tax=Dreissena polymorpha TaxID=45954 RepID=A0A9D4IF04_DREPO|nr:hypothetical protein DPMN_171266 [Dreissena polymorpha]
MPTPLKCCLPTTGFCMSDPIAVLLTDHWFQHYRPHSTAANRPMVSGMSASIEVLLTDHWFQACPTRLQCCLPTSDLSDPIAMLLTDH